MRRCFALALLCLACASGFAPASDPDDVPVIGRPADLPFSEASAGFATQDGDLVCPFVVTATASAIRVEVEQPITLTVTVRAAGRVRHPPVRLDLRDIPAIKRSFHVVDVNDGRKERVSPAEWRWVYQLKPRRAGIDEVPRLPFAFYNPDVRPVEKGFQVIWTDPVAIQVSPTEGPDVRVLSDRVQTLATGPAVLADRRAWDGPGPALLTASLAAPPLGCLVWYVVWRRTYPDAARRARQRRSRAARRAFAALQGASRLEGKAHAEAVARAVVAYLQERFDLPVREPTPDEASAWLAGQGVAEPLRGSLRSLLAGCAAGRFANEGGTPDLAEQARAFITAVEEPPCTPPS